MDRKIEVCGIQLDNLTSDEAVRAIKGYFGKGRLYVVSYIYGSLLKLLVQDEAFGKEMTAASDLALIGEKAVAEVLEETCGFTDEEMSGQAVANRILQYCAKHQRTIYWIGDTEKSYEIFRTYADREFPQLKVIGAFAAGDEESLELEDAVINDINRLSPDVILSKLSSPYQEQFIGRNKQKLNAQVWMGLSSKACLAKGEVPASSKIKAMIDKTLLRRAVNAGKLEE